MKATLFTLLMITCFARLAEAQTRQEATALIVAPVAGTPRVFDIDPAALRTNKSRILSKDESILPAYTLLIKEADKGLGFAPVSVMEKTDFPPSGNKHDYMSLAPYFWPDPSKPGGLPYIRKDGHVNPEVKNYKDKENMPAMCGVISTLALAYYFSDEEKYAEHAALLMRTWFLDTATRMNPNLNYGQAMKGHNTGRAAGLIDTRHFIKVIDAAGLISRSKAWQPGDHSGLQQWFAEFLRWMQTSKIGLNEMAATNNHGAWYDSQRLSMALFTDSAALVKSIIASAASRLDRQVDTDGRFPEEMERTNSFHYTAFTMNAFFSIARQSATAGYDFWQLVTASGKSLRMAFDKFYPYLVQDKKWDGPQIKIFNPEDGYSILFDAAAHLGCSQCRQKLDSLAGDKARRLLLNLLY
ncbi:MAG: hypothetical protein EOO05_10415 [Chitinophagaceae bacterium]|nr:MAG: hypothetical protein EOO05_10415 [Chitinophagaceae bacterium]